MGIPAICRKIADAFVNHDHDRAQQTYDWNTWTQLDPDSAVECRSDVMLELNILDRWNQRLSPNPTPRKHATDLDCYGIVRSDVWQ